MSNIVIPYRGYLTQLNNVQPDVPQSDLVVDFNPSKGIYDTATWNGSVYVGSGPITTDNTACALVTNQAGYENPVTNTIPTFRQTSPGRRPIWRSGDTEANGKPYLDFQSSGDFFYFGIHTSSLNELEELSIYVVTLPSSSAPSSTNYIYSNQEDWYGYQGGWASWYSTNGGTVYSVAGGDSDIDPNKISNYDPDTNDVQIISHLVKGDNTPYEHSSRVQNEGSSVDARDSETGDGFVSWPPSGTSIFLLGASYGRENSQPTTPQRYYTGRMYRFLIYDKAHSNAEQLQVFSDLSTVYGI